MLSRQLIWSSVILLFLGCAIVSAIDPPLCHTTGVEEGVIPNHPSWRIGKVEVYNQEFLITACAPLFKGDTEVARISEVHFLGDAVLIRRCSSYASVMSVSLNNAPDEAANEDFVWLRWPSGDASPTPEALGLEQHSGTSFCNKYLAYWTVGPTVSAVVFDLAAMRIVKRVRVGTLPTGPDKPQFLPAPAWDDAGKHVIFDSTNGDLFGTRLNEGNRKVTLSI